MHLCERAADDLDCLSEADAGHAHAGTLSEIVHGGYALPTSWKSEVRIDDLSVPGSDPNADMLLKTAAGLNCQKSTARKDRSGNG